MKKILTFSEYKKKSKKKKRRIKNSNEEEDEFFHPTKQAAKFYQLPGYNSWGGNQGV